MNDRIDPDLFNLVSNVGRELKNIDQITEKHSGSQPDAFRIDLSKVVKPGASFAPAFDPTINMPDPAANIGWESLPESDKALLGSLPPPPPERQVFDRISPQNSPPIQQSDDRQLEMTFAQTTIDDIYNRLDAIENTLKHILKLLKK